MFQDIISKLKSNRSTTVDDRILIIDGLNLFIRIWASVPVISENGEHIGGVLGFLRSLALSIREFNPSRCIVVFDGKGGSQRRRKLYPDYKMNRKTSHNLRRDHFNSAEDEKISFNQQLYQVIQYLDNMPIQVFSIDNIEADDVIAFIASNYYANTENKIRIISTDRDFLQLVSSDKVEVYSPVKKKLYTPPELSLELGIHEDNYLIYRTLTGDDSDNIDGVRGIGLKTLLKSFPDLVEKRIDLEYLLSFSLERVNSDKKCKTIYKNIIENVDIINRNHVLMQLSDVDISGQSKMQIIDGLKGSVPAFNRYEIKKMMRDDSLTNHFKDLESWLSTTFNSLVVWSK